MHRRELAEYYIWWVSIANQELNGPNQFRWRQWLEHEHASGKIDEAIGWCLNDPQSAETGLRLGANLWRFWFLQEKLENWYVKVKAIFKRDEQRSPTWARGTVLIGLGNFSLILKTDNPEQYFYESQKIGETLRDQSLVAESLIGIGEIAYERGDYVQAQANFDESLKLFKQWKDLRGEARALKWMCILEYRQNNDNSYESAMNFARQSLSIVDKIGNKYLSADCYMEMATVCSNNNRDDLAAKYYGEALVEIETIGDKRREANVRNNLSALAYCLKDYKKCRDEARKALSLFHELGIPKGKAYALINLAASEIVDNHLPSAIRSLKESLDLLSPADGAAPDTYGISFILDEVSRFCMLTGKPDFAAQLYAAAAFLRRSINVDMPDSNEVAYGRLREEILNRLGEDAFGEAYRSGEKLSLTEVINLVRSVH